MVPAHNAHDDAGVIPFPHSVRRFVSQGLDWALWGLIVFGVLAMVAAKYGLKLLG